ncbi:hypothetical protein GQ44DRAFT_721280 [Phaeosphaeriaceae sp. PMI808]|nr:hypothetical protein GQ44DRAFT_721280 [Phaeosphaeriaceae sp. PMI808]
MKTASLTTAAALLSSAYAATVKIETTKCLNANIPLQKFDIEMNLSGPVARDDLKSICGLRIVSASDGIDLNTIRCQAFKDVVGEHPRSAVFTYARPALISTNPKEVKAIGCKYPTGDKVRRQFNNTANISSLSGDVSSLPVSTLLATITLSNVSSSVDSSTVTTTTNANPSSGLLSPSSNSTTPSVTQTPTPSQPSASPSQSAGAASAVSVGMSVIVVAFAAMLG